MYHFLRLSKIALLAGFIFALVSGCAGSAKQESSGEYIDDTVITTKVKSGLFGQEGFGSLDISVETFKGTVQLSGFVNTKEQKQRAESISRSIDGVISVENSLIVKE